MRDSLALASDTNRLLREYVQVNDSIFGGAVWGSLRRILPIPGLFEAIPYAAYRETLHRIRTTLSQVRNEAGERSYGGDTLFNVALADYIGALSNAVALLEELCLALAAKAKGHPYSWSEYRRTLREYEGVQLAYVRLGGPLSQAFAEMTREQRRPLGATREESATVPVTSSASADYLTTIEEVHSAFHHVGTHEELLAWLRLPGARELTQLPPYQPLQDSIPLPQGFTRKLYEYSDPLGKVVIDVVFHGSELVNVRAQLFPNAPGQLLLEGSLQPLLHRLFGQPTGTTLGMKVYKRGELVAMAGQPPGTGSVSCYIMAARFAGV